MSFLWRFPSLVSDCMPKTKTYETKRIHTHIYKIVCCAPCCGRRSGKKASNAQSRDRFIGRFFSSFRGWDKFLVNAVCCHATKTISLYHDPILSCALVLALLKTCGVAEDVALLLVEGCQKSFFWVFGCLGQRRRAV